MEWQSPPSAGTGDRLCKWDPWPPSITPGPRTHPHPPGRQLGDAHNQWHRGCLRTAPGPLCRTIRHHGGGNGAHRASTAGARRTGQPHPQPGNVTVTHAMLAELGKTTLTKLPRGSACRRTALGLPGSTGGGLPTAEGQHSPPSRPGLTARCQEALCVHRVLAAK